MKINEAKRRMLEGRPSVGAVASLGAPLIAERLSLSGCDHVIIDQQHGAWDDPKTLAALRGVMIGPAVPMARVPKNDYALIGRVLDQGALGVIVPMVNTAAEAEAAAYATRYPPRGGRSWGPFGTGGHGSGYGERADDEILLLVQIETSQAVENAREILATDGVDGCWIGPADLARSMGADYQSAAGTPHVEAAIEDVLVACRETGKLPGIYAVGVSERRLEQGFLFVSAIHDEVLIVDGAQSVLDSLQR
jgi:4-hydroxy-2-oxoheptanedioate aldolase